MDVILIEDVPKLGDMGEVVTVKPGYARNYLIPQKLAVRASKASVAQFEHQKKMIESRKAKKAAAAKETLTGLDGLSVTVARKVADSDKLFGSVTNRDISRVLLEHGFEVDHKKVLRDHPIRELGIWPVELKLHADIVANVKIWVVAM